jgi:peptide deformylase
MAVREILLLGNPLLYDVSEPVEQGELARMADVAAELHDTLIDFRKRYGAGRAIAAPQVGVRKRLICMCIHGDVTVFVNPSLSALSVDMMSVWDDCMCFPDLLVRVMRHGTCRLRYRDLRWTEHEMLLEGDLSELLQHEYDHLDGVLAVSRAMDGHSFALRSQRRFLES